MAPTAAASTLSPSLPDVNETSTREYLARRFHRCALSAFVHNHKTEDRLTRATVVPSKGDDPDSILGRPCNFIRAVYAYSKLFPTRSILALRLGAFCAKSLRELNKIVWEKMDASVNSRFTRTSVLFYFFLRDILEKVKVAT